MSSVVTQTTDAFNLMLFAVPLCVLYYVGVFASYLLVLRRENRGFPWKMFFIVVAVVLVLAGSLGALAMIKYGYRF